MHMDKVSRLSLGIGFTRVAYLLYSLMLIYVTFNVYFNRIGILESRSRLFRLVIFQYAFVSMIAGAW